MVISRQDEDVLKDFSDGKNMPLEELFNTMCNSTRIQCKLITTSNKDPNLLPDGGIIRRAIIQQYTSRFVSQDAVDSENHKTQHGWTLGSRKTLTNWPTFISYSKKDAPHL